MTCYGDKTYCPFFAACLDGGICSRALTPLVETAARIAHQPVARYKERPECFRVENPKP